MASTPTTTSFSAALGRLTWMLLGPFFLVLTIFAIVRGEKSWWTGADLTFFVVLAAMLLGRCLEFRGGHPETASGEPATPAHLRRYLVVAGAGGLLAWVAANLLWYWGLVG